VPVALVSGANRSIGRETARQLAGRGYDVIVAVRDEAKASDGPTGGFFRDGEPVVF
jgi:NAD(P)-dependent dehydrogenase (short-subunit alcohol dehydrogenase family)